MTTDQRPCPHEKFAASVEVARLAEREGGPVKGFSASIWVNCADCGEDFEWMGLPAGLSPREPRSSVDGRELRAPLRPVSASAGFGENGLAFMVRVRP